MASLVKTRTLSVKPCEGIIYAAIPVTTITNLHLAASTHEELACRRSLPRRALGGVPRYGVGVAVATLDTTLVKKDDVNAAIAEG